MFFSLKLLFVKIFQVNSGFRAKAYVQIKGNEIHIYLQSTNIKSKVKPHDE